MKFTITASFVRFGGSETTYRNLIVNERNEVSLTESLEYEGTIFGSEDEVRAVLIDALQNPDKYKNLTNYGKEIKLQVNWHGPKYKAYHDSLTIAFK